MSSSKFVKVGALALACASVVSAEKVYTCDASDTYEGSDFFEGFNFFTGLDPTRGYVQYQSKADAASSKFGGPLTEIKNGKAYIGVDHWNKYSPIGDGRPSVRIETKKTYTHGLYLLDIAHMPASICGTWPAFWSFSDVNYPAQGEIDILENIHENTVSLNALHTSPGFSISGNKIANQQSGEVTSYNCDDTAQSSDYGPQYLNQGCASINKDPNSYGKSLNAIGGGVYAMEWTSDVIRMWNFGAGKVPSDITSGKPKPSTWGTPSFTTANGKGDIDAHFKDHKLVLDTTFCGNYAGQDVFWKATSCYDPVKYPTCSSYVGANPAAFKDASWLVNSLKVYKLTEPVIPPTDTTTSLSSTKSITALPTHYGNSSIPATPTPTGGPLTTSTVYSTSTGTVTSCAPTITNCPLGSVTTVVVPLYTTICPVEANPTGKPGSESGSSPAPTSGPGCSGPSCHSNGSGSGGSSGSESTPPPASGSGSSSGSSSSGSTLPPPASGSGSSGSSSSGNTPSLSCIGASCPPASGSSASSDSSSSTTPPTTSGSGSGSNTSSNSCSGPSCSSTSSPPSSSGSSSGSSSSTTPTTCSGASCPPASGPGAPSSSAGVTLPAPACGGVGSPACPVSTLIVTPTKGSGNGTAVGTSGVAGPTSGINLSYTPITTNGAGVVRAGSALTVIVGLVAAMLM